MTELNPNHPVTRFVGDQWHKFCALLMHKFDLDSVEITPEDVASLQAREGGANIVCDTRGGRLVLRLVTSAEAERIAHDEGGLPT